MKNKLWVVPTVAVSLLPGSSQAHFRQTQTASWLVENPLGGPQKAATAQFSGIKAARRP